MKSKVVARKFENTLPIVIRYAENNVVGSLSQHFQQREFSLRCNVVGFALPQPAFPPDPRCNGIWMH
jgi:hypothetical protein